MHDLKKICLIIFGLLLSISVNAGDLINQLRDHPAPCLALHGDDPVAWQQWNEEVTNRAKRENKILYLSVGCFACH